MSFLVVLGHNIVLTLPADSVPLSAGSRAFDQLVCNPLTARLSGMACWFNGDERNRSSYDMGFIGNAAINRPSCCAAVTQPQCSVHTNFSSPSFQRASCHLC